MSPREKKPTPVFVFLDENIAGLDKEVAQAFLRWYDTVNFTLYIFPFPKSKKGKKDWQVVLYLQQAVFSSHYPIRDLAEDNPAPIVLFLTLDINFIEDAQRGFNKSDKRWHLHEQFIEFNEEGFVFKEEGRVVTVPVLAVHYTEKDKKQGLPKVLARSLSKFLSKQ